MLEYQAGIGLEMVPGTRGRIRSDLLLKEAIRSVTASCRPWHPYLFLLCCSLLWRNCCTLMEVKEIRTSVRDHLHRKQHNRSRGIVAARYEEVGS